MTTTQMIVAVVVLAIAAAVGYFIVRGNRSRRLRERFGPEYARTVDQYDGERGRAEADLAKRQQRVERLDIQPLFGEQREEFAGRWKDLQARFVDDPSRTIGAADELVAEVMQARGYPVGEFDQRAADVSVDHPQVVEHYRAAHAIAERHREGSVSTEELRGALLHYRALFDDLLEAGERVPEPRAPRSEDRRTAAPEGERAPEGETAADELSSEARPRDRSDATVGERDEERDERAEVRR